jgi:hypothetical protein
MLKRAVDVAELDDFTSCWPGLGVLR